jgi:hypothetical protein
MCTALDIKPLQSGGVSTSFKLSLAVWILWYLILNLFANILMGFEGSSKVSNNAKELGDSLS